MGRHAPRHGERCFQISAFPRTWPRKTAIPQEQENFFHAGVDVFFTGEQFDQADLDVYLEILHFLKDQPSGTDCTFTAYGLLKAIERSTGNKDHQWLHSVLIRLTACAVDMTDHKKRYFGSLLDGGIKDEITKHYTIAVNQQFAELFKRSWSSLEHEQRRRLKGSPRPKPSMLTIPPTLPQGRMTSLRWRALLDCITATSGTSRRGSSRPMT